MMDDIAAFGGLFVTAFLSATVLPAQSEFVLAGLHATDAYGRWMLVAVATVGNVLGSVLNWALGRYIEHFKDRRWFPVKASLLERAERWYGHWGVWSLLLAWAPVVGDPFTLVAGMLRTNFWIFLLLVTIGKLGLPTEALPSSVAFQAFSKDFYNPVR